MELKAVADKVDCKSFLRFIIGGVDLVVGIGASLLLKSLIPSGCNDDGKLIDGRLSDRLDVLVTSSANDEVQQKHVNATSARSR
jgi:hypothetical protein